MKVFKVVLKEAGFSIPKKKCDKDLRAEGSPWIE